MPRQTFSEEQLQPPMFTYFHQNLCCALSLLGAEGCTGCCPTNLQSLQRLAGEASGSLQATAMHICMDGRRRQIDPVVFLIPVPFVMWGLPSSPGVLISPPGFKATLIISITRLALARQAPGCHRTSCAGICSSEGPSDLEGTIHIHSHRFK